MDSKKRFILTLLVLCFAFISVTPLTAQELIISKVYMKDGNIFIGEITRYEAGTITVKTEYGTFKLNEDKVKYISISGVEPKETYKELCIVLKDGKVIPGKISSYISILKKVKVSSTYGDVTIERFKDIALIILEPIEVTPKIIFFDDFNDNKIDPEKWTYKGNRVVEENGIMKVETTVTDAGGQLYSRPIEIDPQKLLIITRKVKLHYANEYFTGFFIVSNNETQIFIVNYCNFSYSDNKEQPTFGFFISKGGIAAISSIHREYISGRIEPVWDQWFDEKIIYNPATGLIKYFINNEKRMEFKVEPLPNLHYINLTINADGWWTGHYQYFDDLKIIQSEKEDLSY